MLTATEALMLPSTLLQSEDVATCHLRCTFRSLSLFCVCVISVIRGGGGVNVVRSRDLIPQINT